MKEINRVKLPSITYIVARSYDNHVIGCDNKLPWRLSSDLRQFKRLTTDHAIIMGRKTYESIGKPLPNRLNIVLSRSRVGNSEGAIWVKDAAESLFVADIYSILNNKEEIFVIGGAEVYDIYIKLIQKIYLTEVFCGQVEGDSFFRPEFDRRIWKLANEVDFPKSDLDEYSFRILTYIKKRKYTRLIKYYEFMHEFEERNMWVSDKNKKKVEEYLCDNQVDLETIKQEELFADIN